MATDSRRLSSGLYFCGIIYYNYLTNILNQQCIIIMASDYQNLDHDKLSSTAKRMLELRDDVFLEWVKRLRQTVKEAEKLPQPILIDTLPVLYGNLA